MITNGHFKKYIIDAVISVRNEIDKDPIIKRDVADLAVDVGIGRNLLKKSFKYIIGSSIKDYRLNKRMEKAKDLLEEGRLTLKQIAHLLGYSSPANFSTTFKKKFGFSPNEFQGQYFEAI